MAATYQQKIQELEAAKNEAERQLRASQQTAGAVLASKHLNPIVAQ